MEHLHPGAKWLFRISGFFAALFILIFFTGFLGSIVGVFAGLLLGGGPRVIMLILLGIVFYLILVIIIAEIYARMAYKRWKYEFTTTSLKLERGIIWKRYSNIPYERVQNVDVHRGILARICGFSTVDIQTAGFHGGYGRRGMPRSEGHLPAVSIEKAEQIREFVMKKITGKSSLKQGL